jgi:hypothetical protein
VLRGGELAEHRFYAADVDFVEIAVAEEVPQIVIVRADCVPQLGVDWMVIQPEVVRTHPAWGWEPVPRDGLLFLGGGEGLPPRIKLRPSDPESLCSIGSLGPEAVKVQNLSQGPLRLVSQRPLPAGEELAD